MIRPKVSEKVWLHLPTGKLGVALTNTFFGVIFLFAEHSPNEVLNERFCNFVDDPMDKKSYRSQDFLDLGYL